MKSRDTAKELSKLRASILREKASLEAKLEEITQALGEVDSGSIRSMGSVAPRVRNELSLKEAIIKVTTGKPLTKDQILVEIGKLGYQFQTANPKNSVRVVLYGKKPKFKNADGRFSPA